MNFEPEEIFQPGSTLAVNSCMMVHCGCISMQGSNVLDSKSIWIVGQSHADGVPLPQIRGRRGAHTPHGYGRAMAVIKRDGRGCSED